MNNKKITIYTQVYNTEKYLRQCLDSVVNQSYPIHQYIIVDNGCTDGCSEIIQEYAEKYGFIEVIKHETNQRQFSYRLISEKATGDYLAYIDSDDWWELDYLEKLVTFLEENDLDLVLTGSLKYMDETGERRTHSPDIDKNVILTQKQFAENYNKYNMFSSALWGSVMKFEIYKNIDAKGVLAKVKDMPNDTAFMLEYTKKCNKIGIRDDKMYNYRIRKNSITYQYNPERFPSALGYREILIGFLEKNDVYDDYYKEWVKMVFLYYLFTAITTLKNSNSSPELKISESLKVLKHNIVQDTLANHFSKNKNDFLLSVKELLTENVVKLEKTEDKERAKESIELLSPTLGRFFDFNHVVLYAENPDLWNALLNNDVKEFTRIIFSLLEKGVYKSVDLADLIMKLIPENTIMSEVENKEFFNTYPEICSVLFCSNTTESLNKMTEILFSGNELNCPEDFLNIYIKLAALENHVEAFLFGNIQKAYLFLDENRKNEARQIVNDLVEMGAGEAEDVVALKAMLN